MTTVKNEAFNGLLHENFYLVGELPISPSRESPSYTYIYICIYVCIYCNINNIICIRCIRNIYNIYMY